MKTILRKIGMRVIVFSMLVIGANCMSQTANFANTRITLRTNGGGNTSYNLTNNASLTNFNRLDFGSFCQGTSNGVIIRGGQNSITSSNNSCTVSSSVIEYRVYETGTSPSGFTSLNIPFVSTALGSPSGFTNLYRLNTSTTNLLTGLSAGNYTFEVKTSLVSACNSTSTSIFTATFTVIPLLTVYADNDGDGFGDLNSSTQNCSAPSGYVSNSTDCNDNDPDLFEKFSFYTDSDSDGYGTGTLVLVCALSSMDSPAGFSVNNFDCDDNNASVNPAQTEIAYNGIDDNCDGNLDEGFPLILSKMVVSQCGTTLVNMWDSVYTTLVQNSTACRYRVKNMTTNSVQYLVKGGSTRQWFQFNSLANYDYATTYMIDVELQVNGTWLGYYGDTCTINSPGFIAISPVGVCNLNVASCGKTQTSLADVITAVNISGATGYRYEVTNQNTGLQIGVIDRTLPWFNMTMFPTAAVYGTPYTVRVAIKTTGTYGAFGVPCTIYTPTVLGLNAATCGLVATAKWNTFNTVSRNAVTMYRYQVTNSVTSQVQILDRPSTWFNITMLPSGYTPNTVYSVQVAYSTSPTSGLLVFSPFSTSCNITAPSMARSAFATEDPTEVANNEFKVNALPNPFSYNFGLDLRSSADSVVAIKVYDMIGKLLESKEVQITEINNVSIGENYTAGVYNVIVSQGDNLKTLRVIKR